MSPHRLPFAVLSGLLLLGSASIARANEPGPSDAPALPPPAAQPTTTVQSAPSSGGLTVVAPLAGGGSLTAVGCSAVSVSGHSTDVRAGGPALAAAGTPCPVAPSAPLRPRYAPDSGRKAAIITAPIVYGLGSVIAGVSYLSHNASCSDNYGSRYGANSDHCAAASRALWAYGAITATVPSLPRWVVGDTGRALAFSAARGGSVAAAALIDWGSATDSWVGPFFFGFGAPVALAVVDMATTPHREDLEDRPSDKPADAPAGEEPHHPREQAKAIAPRITAIAPAPVGDREHRAQGGSVTLSGTF